MKKEPKEVSNTRSKGGLEPTCVSRGTGLTSRTSRPYSRACCPAASAPPRPRCHFPHRNVSQKVSLLESHGKSPLGITPASHLLDDAGQMAGAAALPRPRQLRGQPPVLSAADDIAQPELGRAADKVMLRQVRRWCVNLSELQSVRASPEKGTEKRPKVAQNGRRRRRSGTTASARRSTRS